MSGLFFYISVLGLASGVFFHSFFDFGFSFSFCILFLSLASFAACFVSSSKEERSKKEIILLFILFLFCFAVGSLRYDISNIVHNPSFLAKYDGAKVKVTGVIVDEPDKRKNNVRLTVLTSSIAVVSNGEEVGESKKEKILIVADLYPAFSYGDKVEITGKLERPKNIDAPGARPFDYVSYLAKDNIFYMMSFVKVTLLKSGEGNVVKEKLFAIKNALLHNLENSLPEPHASLAGGLLVGGKNALPKDLENDFRTAGIVHIIVLSGYNIMIVAESIMKVLLFLPRSLGLFAGVLSVVLFALMTGGAATVVRASIMAIIALLGKYARKQYAVNRALFFAGAVMILQNPKILVFDFSFELSFLATLGLIHLSPLVEPKLSFVTKKFHLREYVVSSIATQIIVSPLILYRMGAISVVSLPVNMLVLFLIPTTMFFSFITSVSGFLGSVFAIPSAFITYCLIQYELGVVGVFSKLPFAAAEIPYFPAWLMALSYFFIGAGFLAIQKRQRKFFPTAALDSGKAS